MSGTTPGGDSTNRLRSQADCRDSPFKDAMGLRLSASRISTTFGGFGWATALTSWPLRFCSISRSTFFRYSPSCSSGLNGEAACR